MKRKRQWTGREKEREEMLDSDSKLCNKNKAQTDGLLQKKRSKTIDKIVLNSESPKKQLFLNMMNKKK